MSAGPIHHGFADDRLGPADRDHRTGHQRRPISTHPHSNPQPPPHPHPRPHHERRGAAARSAGDDRAAAPGVARRRAPGGAPTLGRAGRRIRIGLAAFWTMIGTLTITAGWSAIRTYSAFQDDVVARMAARQAEMQFAYEDHLAEMRVQVDRATSRQLLDQEQIEAKLDQILRRQAVLENRATALGTIAEASVTGPLRAGARPAPPSPAAPAPVAPPASAPKPSPISGPALFSTPALRETKFDRRRLADPAPPSAARQGGKEGKAGPPGNVQAVLARLSESLDRVEGRQTTALAALEAGYDAKARRLRGVLADAGIDPDKAAAKAAGGPFVAYRPPVNAGAFERQVYRINVARAEAERLNATLGTVPLRKPVEGEIDTSSGFGVRIDPFVKRPAMHTGIDFRGDTGEAIRVTAGGRVVVAGWSGGYGRMVEVDHGNGLSTRYGHLSEIDVSVGQTLKAGQTVGRLGSTGRSTGPHLHYETRINGESVDPTRFLHAGTKSGLM